jgi:hypothetical protein
MVPPGLARSSLITSRYCTSVSTRSVKVKFSTVAGMLSCHVRADDTAFLPRIW